MTRLRFADTVVLALAQKTVGMKALYLFKGLVFYPFLVKGSRGKEKNELSEAGRVDFAYPVF